MAAAPVSHSITASPTRFDHTECPPRAPYLWAIIVTSATGIWTASHWNEERWMNRKGPKIYKTDRQRQRQTERERNRDKQRERETERERER